MSVKKGDALEITKEQNGDAKFHVRIGEKYVGFVLEKKHIIDVIAKLCRVDDIEHFHLPKAESEDKDGK